MTKFKKATKLQAKLRLAIAGLSGAGKTYSSLAIATGLGGRIAVIDSERGSASKYSDTYDFDVLELESFSPDEYVAAILAAEEEGYDVLVIDSLSAAWSGKGGALEMVDEAARRSKSANSFQAWKDVTPKHQRMIDTILNSRCHVIGTLRAKTEYVLEENDRGKKVPRKVGMAPVQRADFEYDWDVVLDIDRDHVACVTKSRCPPLADKVIDKPGAQLAATLKQWLSGEEPPWQAKLRELETRLDAILSDPGEHQAGELKAIADEAGELPKSANAKAVIGQKYTRAFSSMNQEAQ